MSMDYATAHSGAIVALTAGYLACQAIELSMSAYKSGKIAPILLVDTWLIFIGNPMWSMLSPQCNAHFPRHRSEYQLCRPWDIRVCCLWNLGWFP